MKNTTDTYSSRELFEMAINGGPVRIPVLAIDEPVISDDDTDARENVAEAMEAMWSAMCICKTKEEAASAWFRVGKTRGLIRMAEPK